MTYKDRIKKVCIITSISVLCVSILFLILIVYQISIPCLTYSLLHIQCPGCGGTRMLKSLCKLDFYSAFLYNPFLFITLPLLGLVYVIESIFYIKKGFYHNWLNTFLIIYAIIFIIFGIIRNFI